MKIVETVNIGDVVNIRDIYNNLFGSHDIEPMCSM